MKLRIDYHLHPNLSGNETKAVAQCKKWWSAIEKNSLNCVLITEHSYKNPKRAFELMYKEKPKGLFCFPGVEYVTKEGIDIIIFSKDPAIYDFGELKSFKSTYFEIIDFVNSQKNLFSFVTHPYTLGLTSVLKRLNREKYMKSVNALGAVEISNGAFDNLKIILQKFPFCRIFKSRLDDIEKTEALPVADYPQEIKFLAAGSDAHHPESLGLFFEMDIGANESIFEKIVGNHGNGRVVTQKLSFNLFLLLKSGLTSLNEFLIKRRLR